MVYCRGYVTTLDESYHVDSIDKQLTGRHLIFRESDYVGEKFTCGMTQLSAFSVSR